MRIHTQEALQDRELVSRFFQQHKMLLYREAWKYLSLKEDVEDIVQETLARILDNMDKFRHMAPLQQLRYSQVIIRNLAFSHLKRGNRFTMIPFEELDVYLPMPEESQPEYRIEAQLQAQQIRKIWGQIAPEDRLLLEQKYILQWSDQQIAQQFGIRPQSVRMRLTRAKRSVMQQLQQRNIRIDEWLR